MKQKYLTMLLSVLMSMFGAKAFAHDIEVKNADGVTIYYNFINDGTELEVTYSGDSSIRYSDNVVIPESITYYVNTYSVTSIGYHAFYNCSGLTELTIPNSVTSIGNYAFEKCSGLASVNIPNSVTSIGNGVFSNCSGLTSVSIPNSVTSIGIAAFYNCSSLTEIVIPNSVTSIDYEAFALCGNLAKVTIGKNVTDIKSAAFALCSSLTELVIPSSVTSIDAGAFSGCSGLISVISQSTTPPIIGNMYNSAFDPTTEQNATLHVPTGCKEAYQQAEYWKNFWNIQDDASTGIESIRVDKQEKTTIYTLDGKQLNTTNTADLPTGIYIINGKKVAVK